MLSFQKLDVYRCATEFLALTVGLSEEIPRGNASILDQLRRAATSIPLNIAEAAGRTGGADAARAYAIARGSAMECAAVLDALTILKLVDPDVHRQGLELLERIEFPDLAHGLVAVAVAVHDADNEISDRARRLIAGQAAGWRLWCLW